jgi:tetratricopeptide (TPR) repeat protein
MKRRVLVLTPLLLACGPFFYQAPPPLESYPQRIPGKGWRELFAEVKPLAADAASSPQLIDAAKALVAELPKLPQAERLAKIDALLTRNREGDFNYRVANFLHELREIAADEPALAAAEPYLGWRLGQPLLGNGAVGRAPIRLWSQTDEQFQEAVNRYQQALAQPIQWFQEAQASAIPEMLPYLLVQRAALDFENQNFPAAVERFDEIIERFPGHPRAEVARFMKGRSQLAAAQAQKKSADQDAAGDRERTIAASLQQAHDDFHAYLEHHPKGRFASDANGWLGAVAAAQGNYPEAIARQLARLSLQPSRETTRSVLRECDSLFAPLFHAPATPDDGEPAAHEIPWDAMVNHPELVRLFVFQAMDPAARESLPSLDRNLAGDRDTLDFLHRRIIRPIPFAKEAMRYLGEAVVRSSGVREPDAFTLEVLGWASLRAEDPQQALALFDRALAAKRGDDVLHGRALALSSLDRHREAAIAYQELARDFPGSRLGIATAFEAAIARFHAGAAGDALLALLPLSGNAHEANPALAGLLPEHLCAQWIDSIAQFAPIDQLAAPLARLPEGDPQARLLRTIVRSRALCAGNFAIARRYLDPLGEPATDTDPSFAELPRGIGLTAAIWRQEVESLAGAIELLDGAPADQKARKHLHIGRRWKDLRGRLTLPLHQLFDYSQSESEKLEQLRRKNAVFLGFAPDAVAAELDSRDELHHALRHFLAAAESSDPDIAAPALEEANEALFRLAEFSHYRCSRAVETDASGLSRKLVERLRRDFPDRPETARAAIWSFAPPSLLGRWMPGDYTPGNSADAIESAVVDPRSGRWHEWDPKPGDAEGERLRQDFGNLLNAPGDDMPAIRKRLADFRADFDRTRHQLAERDVLSLVDDLDDLASAAELADITPDLFSRYASLRRAKNQPPPAAGEWEPLAPWLAFLDRIRTVTTPGGYEQANNDTTEAWERYLREFPNGPKSEAASLRLLRGKVRAACPIPQVQAFHFPEAPIPNGYKRLTRPPEADGATLRALTKALDEHESRFPSGRYRADIRVMRAAVAAQSRDYPVAVKCLAEVLEDPAHPELRMNAALYFSEISLRLLDPHERAAVVAAFRSERAAVPFLKNLVHGDTCLFRLRPLMAWLETPQ